MARVLFEHHPISAHRLGPQAEEAFYARFCRTFRASSHYDRVITRLQWTNYELVSPSILRSPVLDEQKRLYVVLETPGMVYVSNAATIRSFFEQPHAQAEHYIVDDSLVWCLAITHDDHYCLVDPDHVLGVSGEQMDMTS